MNNEMKLKIIKQIIKEYYDYADSPKEYKEGIIDAVWTVLNMDEE